MTSTQSITAAILCCLSLVYSIETSANSWRVNYDKRANADFQDLNAAMTDGRVVNGDTLYLDKGCTISSQQTISKTVTVIGPGYFIGENDADEAYFSNTIFIEASDVKLTGLHTSSIAVRENNVVIERCRVTGYIAASQGYENDNASIFSCFINGYVEGQGANGADEWKILGNIFYAQNPSFYNLISNFDNVLIDHNTLYYFRNAYTSIISSVFNSTITNNIIVCDYYTVSNIANTSVENGNSISHNISNKEINNSDVNPNNILADIKQATIFNENGERDANYIEALPAEWMIYASDGGSVGAFGGAYPYVKNGYPLYVPRFESISVPSQPGQDGKLHINLVIKNQNK